MRRAAGVLITFVALGALLAVGAATPASAGPGPIVVTTAGDVVDSGDGLLSLREAVTQAEDDGVDAAIQLAWETTYELDLCGVPGDDAVLHHSGGDPLEIWGGDGTVIEGCADFGIFAVEAHLGLHQVEITGADGTSVGVASADTVQLDHVQLYYNGGPDRHAQNLVHGESGVEILDSTIDAEAGANSIAGWPVETYGPLDVQRSTIRGTDAGAAGALLGAPVTLTDSEVVDNEGRIAAVGSVCDVTATDSTIARNSSTEESEQNIGPIGGGIVATGVVTIEGGTIEDNSTAARGGGIRAGAVRVEGTSVTGNAAAIAGGAIDTSTIPDPVLTIERPASCGEPPVALDGSVVLDDVELVANTAPEAGGAVLAEGALDLVDTTVTGHVASPQDVVWATDVTITGSAIEGNSTTNGYVVFANGEMSVAGSAVTDNDAQASVLGGYLGLTVEQAEVHDNVGDLFGPLTAGCDLVLDGVTATGNQAGVRGGVGGSEGTTYVFDSTLSDNSSVGNGGALVASAVHVEGSTVAGNEAHGDGGGIEVDIFEQSPLDECEPTDPELPVIDEGTVRLERSTVSGNDAGGDGGGVHADGGFVDVLRSTVSGNEAAGDGGGLAASFEVLVSDSTITANAAARGGGLAVVHDDGEARVDASTVNANAAAHADDIAAPTLVLSGAAVGSPQALGGDCEVDAVVSQGSVVVDPACIGSGHEDLVVPALGLGDLTNNGGGTLTRMPDPSSPLVDHSFPACAHFSTHDQRNVSRYQSGNGCDTGAVESPWTRFLDVSPAHPFFDEITGLASDDVIVGYGDRTFRPSTTVSRQAAVTWLYRLSGSPAVVVPSPTTFPDVGASHPFLEEVEWAAAEGITEGYIDGTFRPSAGVTRQALVAWLYDLVGPDVDPPAQATFDDVSPSHPFFAEVEWAASEGIVNGYDDGTFRPGSSVTRQAAAAILDRAQALL